MKRQNIGCKLLPKEEKFWKFETWPFTHYQTRSGILKHCVIAQSFRQVQTSESDEHLEQVETCNKSIKLV